MAALEFHFKKIRLKDGLTDNRFNNYIYQDSRGFVWISSLSGLNRFDGLRVKKYRFDSGLTGSNIQSDFFEDKEGNIWFSTFIALNCYVRQLDSILTIPIRDSTGIVLTQNYKVFHLDHTNDRLWLKVGDRIFGLNTEAPYEYFALPKKTNGTQFSTLSHVNGGLKTIVASPWWNGDGIDFFHIRDTQLIEHKQYLDNYPFIKKSIPVGDSIWLLMDNQRLFLFDERMPEDISIRTNSVRYKLWDAVKVDENHLLVSTNEEGLWYYNWKDDQFLRQWSVTDPPPTNLSSDSPMEIYISSDNYLWTSIRNLGVDYTYLYNNLFENPLAEFGQQPVEVVSVMEDQNERIWVGVKDQGIKVFSNDGNFLFDYKNLPDMELWQVAQDENGKIFAISSKQLYYLDDKINSFKPIFNPSGLTFRFLSSVYPKRTIVSTNEGLQEVSIDKNGRYFLKPCQEFSDYQEFSFLQVFQTSRQKVYVPYSASELWIYNASTLGLQLIKKVSCDLEFFGFCESRKYAGTIWAGTSKGLIRIVQDTIITFEFGKETELGNSNVYGITEDHTGTLWVSTSQGLWQYQPEDSVLHKYETIDGLSSDLFSFYNSALFSSSGAIWLANNKGLTKFDPSAIKPFLAKPKVYIDQLTVNNLKVIKGIGELDELKLKHNENTITFEVNAIEYHKPIQAKLLYKLENYEEEEKWLSVANGQQIRFTKIPPGYYTFIVKAEDSFGDLSDSKRLHIRIIPPWWKTYWFYLLVAITVAGITYAAYRLRIRQIKQYEKKKTAIAKLELQVVELETKAFRSQMNPHFLSNALNSIKGIILKNETQEASSHITKFSNLIRTILTNSEKKLIVLNKELEALKLYIELESLRFTNKFDYQIQVDKTVDQNFVRIPPLILQPFVENAIWHGLLPKASELKKLSVNIFRRNDFIICEIEDNGVGRKAHDDRNEYDHDSMGVDITKKRIQLLHSANDLYIIDLENDEGKALGTKVIIQLYTPI